MQGVEEGVNGKVDEFRFEKKINGSGKGKERGWFCVSPPFFFITMLLMFPKRRSSSGIYRTSGKGLGTGCGRLVRRSARGEAGRGEDMEEGNPEKKLIERKRKGRRR